MNGTSGKPQPGVPVTLSFIGATGMQPQGTVKSDPEGKFHFQPTPAGPALIQAAYQGVTYNLIMQPGSPSSGLTLTIYDSGTRPGEAKVVQDIVLLEPAGAQLSVRENIIWQNDGKLTYTNPASGPTRVWVPADGKSTLRVSATPPNGLPLEQPASPAAQKDVYKVDFPIRPGETTLEAGYMVPFTSPGPFSGKSLQEGAPLRLVVPKGVTLQGDGLEFLGQEPQSQAFIYQVKSADYKVEIQGTAAAGSSEDEEGGGSGLSEILPRIYDNVYPILGLALAVLALGFVLLYRMRTTPPPTAQKPPAPRSKKRP